LPPVLIEFGNPQVESIQVALDPHLRYATHDITQVFPILSSIEEVEPLPTEHFPDIERSLRQNLCSCLVANQ